MTIETAYVPISYAGNAVTNSFAITFDYQLASQIVAKTEVVATGIITPLVYGTDFTITPNVNSPASFGTLTLLLGSLPNGTNILITRVTDVTQDTSWINNSANPASAFENAVDKLTMIDQEREVTPFDLDGTTDQFLRGDNTLTNTLVGPLGAFVLPADTTAMFIAGQKANASIKVVSAAADQGAFSFGVDGSANPWDMRWVYDASLPALGWQVFGQSIRGTFDNTGLNVTGTVNATLFTGAADASLITTGLVDTARLGSGSATSNSVLYGDQTWRVVTGGGGGINTTTTGTFVIAAANSTQTVPVTSATGIVAGTELQISDGTHQIIGLVTVVASLNLTVKTQQIVLGTAGNTMASGAAVQSSSVPGNNTVLMSDLDHTTPFGVSYMFLTGAFSQAHVPLPNVDLFFLDVIGSTVQLAGSSNSNFILESIHSGTTAKDQLARKALGSTSWTSLFSPSATGDVVRSTDGTTIGFGKLTASDSITAATITPALLNVTNSLTDTQVFSYDSASGHFKMVPNGGSIPGGGDAGKFFRGDNTFSHVLDISLDTNPIGLALAQGEANGNFAAVFQVSSDGTQAVWGVSKKNSGTWDNSVTGVVSNFIVGTGLNGNTLSVGTASSPIDSTHVEDIQIAHMMRTAMGVRSVYGPLSQIFEISAPSSPLAIDLVNGAYQRISSLGLALTITLADTTPLPTSLRYESELTLELNLSSHDITWPGTITWANGVTAPTIANSGLSATGVNIIRLVRRQGQTQWIGVIENPATAGAGTVTSVATGAGLTGGPITTSGTISIPTGGVTTSLIANNAVTSAQIANNTITNGQISTSANITASKLAGFPGNSSFFLNGSGGWTVPGGGGSPFNPLPFIYVPAPTGTPTTDTAAINTAISAAVSNGGGIVVLQAGTYKINSTIMLNDDNVSIIGAGSTGIFNNGAPPTTGTTIQWSNGSALTGAMFLSTKLSGPQGCNYEGFNLSGGTAVGALKAVGMRFGGLHHSSFKNMMMQNFSSIALDLFSLQETGPNHITVDNLAIDVGSLYFLSHSGGLSVSTCIGIRLEEDPGGTGGDVFASSFNNIWIIHNYIGVWMGNSDSNLFTNLHTFAYANTTGPSTPRTPTVAGTPHPGVYVTTNSRLNRIVGCSTDMVFENTGSYPTNTAQCSVYDMDFFDAGSIQAQIYVGVGCEMLLTSPATVNGALPGTYYAGPTAGYTTGATLTQLGRILFDDSTGKVQIYSRNGAGTPVFNA